MKNQKIVCSVCRFLMLLCSILCSSYVYAIDFLHQTTPSIQPETVAVIVNELDANSKLMGEYYVNARGIPTKNLIFVSRPKVSVLDLAAFAKLREKIYAEISPSIQVIVLMWTTPYAVNCNSITSAITLGYDAKQCEDGCATGKKNPYFNSLSRNPAQDFNMRLAILLPTDSIELAKSVIDRGALSSFKLNDSSGYFLKTSDLARTKPREPFFPQFFSLFRVFYGLLHFFVVNCSSHHIFICRVFRYLQFFYRFGRCFYQKSPKVFLRHRIKRGCIFGHGAKGSPP